MQSFLTFDSMDITLKCDYSIIGKLLSITLLWSCLFVTFPGSVILENVFIFDLVLSGVKGLRRGNLKIL